MYEIPLNPHKGPHSASITTAAIILTDILHDAYVRDSTQPPIRALHSASITTAAIILHGILRDAYEYYCYMKYATEIANKTDSTYFIAPHFLLANDLKAPNAFYFSSNTEYMDGGQSDVNTTRISSFKMLDDILLAFNNKKYFPNVHEIVIVGHSTGAQTAHRYAIATGIEKALTVPVRYVLENAGSYAYLDTTRATLPRISVPTCDACDATEIRSAKYAFSALASDQQCPQFNTWKMGLDSGNAYLNLRGKTEIRNDFRHKDVVYLVGTKDTCNTLLEHNCGCSDSSLDTECAAEMQGYCRLMRGAVYYQYLNFYYKTHNQKLYFVDGVGHDGCGMITSNSSIFSIFTATSSGNCVILSLFAVFLSVLLGLM
eukprot:Phypoly_transcript_09324.p1 GENE.Phypoly_transcript_09324~~Phypoly_transcript_09324.p1  ORF type:complete len:373 (+),score=37.87 Phypoly_transcript_09324:273-1391(+)